MFLRIVFDTTCEGWEDTRHLFLGCPNGTCLSFGRNVTPRPITDRAVLFWELSDEYFEESQILLRHIGVASVQVLPIDKSWTFGSGEEFDAMLRRFMPPNPPVPSAS